MESRKTKTKAALAARTESQKKTRKPCRKIDRATEISVDPPSPAPYQISQLCAAENSVFRLRKKETEKNGKLMAYSDRNRPLNKTRCCYRAITVLWDFQSKSFSVCVLGNLLA